MNRREDVAARPFSEYRPAPRRRERGTTVDLRRTAVGVGAVVLLLGAPAWAAGPDEHGKPDKVKECNDTVDNDGDGSVDTADGDCGSPNDNSEGPDAPPEPGPTDPGGLPDVQAVVEELVGQLPQPPGGEPPTLPELPAPPDGLPQPPPGGGEPPTPPVPVPGSPEEVQVLVEELVGEVVGQLPPLAPPPLPPLPAPPA